MSTRGYIRTNFRRGNAGRTLPLGTVSPGLTAIGGGLFKGSWGQGAGNLLPYGGFICGSFNASSASMETVAFSATEAMGSYFQAGGYGAGYQIGPVFVFVESFMGSTSGTVARWYASLLASITYLVFSASESAPTSEFDIHLMWTGFIISAPV